MRKNARKILGEMFFGPKDEAADAGTGLRITGDAGTLQALYEALETCNAQDPDMEEWLDECQQALRAGMKSGTVTLPAFKATPDLDSFDDDSEAGRKYDGSTFAADEEY